ncbi:MAG TPA: hypothetical protein VK279_11565, partial [Solirubrobacteraceae bacterium]|nr:hypothetical protein [Solirubrobacteraceae bacterium]
LGYDAIAQRLATSQGNARQNVHAARDNLRQMSAGREMRCDLVRAAIDERDHHRLRSWRFRGHLMWCSRCGSVAEAVRRRRRAAALLPLASGWGELVAAASGAVKAAAVATALVAGGGAVADLERPPALRPSGPGALVVGGDTRWPQDPAGRPRLATAAVAPPPARSARVAPGRATPTAPDEGGQTASPAPRPAAAAASARVGETSATASAPSADPTPRTTRRRAAPDRRPAPSEGRRRTRAGAPARPWPGGSRRDPLPPRAPEGASARETGFAHAAVRDRFAAPAGRRVPGDAGGPAPLSAPGPADPPAAPSADPLDTATADATAPGSG